MMIAVPIWQASFYAVGHWLGRWICAKINIRGSAGGQWRRQDLLGAV